jgi:hypothetical protein
MPQLYVLFYSFLSQLSSCSAITLGIPWNDANNQTKETCTQDERIRKARLQEFCRLDPLPFFMLFSVFVSYTGIWYPHRMPVRFYVSVFPYSSSCRYSLHFPLTDPSCKQMHPKMFDHTTITKNPTFIVSRFQPYTSRVSIPIPLPISLLIPISIIITTLSLPLAIPLCIVLRLTLIL